MSAPDATSSEPWPTITVVFLAYNRREHLRHSLTKTLRELDYDAEHLNVVVVDNASTDGTSAMLERDFPGVRVVQRASNSGVSGWNDGFAVATGEYVLALDDDCHLPRDGLYQAVAQARRHRADLVSFGVVSAREETHRFDLHEYRTGLFSFWGCAVLMRREALAALGGYDPEIFVWANELELMMRFFDRGYRHLHLPQVVAVHDKAPGDWRGGPIPERAYRVNFHNFGYVAAKLLRRRDATEALIALLARNMRDGWRMDPLAYTGMSDTLSGFRHGLRHRRPVRPAVSRAYRRDFVTFASPWWLSRSVPEMIRDVIGPVRPRHGRRDRWLAERARFYPERLGVLEL